jgi:hypothetical protein
MIEDDIAALIGYFLSSFGLGFSFGYLIRVFTRASDSIR